MNYKEISCNECGKLLKISNNINYLMCNHCGSQLEVVRTSTVIYTQKRRLNPTKQYPSSSAEDVDFYKIRAQIDLLDQEWQNRLPLFMDEGTLPTYYEEKDELGLTTSIVLFLFLTFAGFIFALLLSSWVIIVSIIGLINVIRLVVVYNKREKRLLEFKSEKLEYERKRKDLLKQLNRNQ